MALHRALIATLIDNQEVIVYRGELAIKRLCTDLGVPYPNANRPVLSPSFRSAVYSAGLSIILHDTDTWGSVKFIPPHLIRCIDFYIGEEPVPNMYTPEFEKFMQKFIFGKSIGDGEV